MFWLYKKEVLHKLFSSITKYCEEKAEEEKKEEEKMHQPTAEFS